MALVACTQLKELKLGNTKLTGEWCVVGIDRAPVPSEQRMEQARCNTPGFLIFDAIVIFSGSVPRGSFFRGLWGFLELFFAVRGFVLIRSIYSAPFACQIKRSSAQPSDHSAIHRFK